jgi:hypothetical protein
MYYGNFSKKKFSNVKLMSFLKLNNKTALGSKSCSDCSEQTFQDA